MSSLSTLIRKIHRTRCGVSPNNGRRINEQFSHQTRSGRPRSKCSQVTEDCCTLTSFADGFDISLMGPLAMSMMCVMKICTNAVNFVFGFAMLAGCASTNVTRQTPMTAPGLARPNQIWVYDFIASYSDMPSGSSLAGRVGRPSTAPTSEELEAGRRYGALIAQDLVQNIQAMGMPAIQAGPGASPQVGDAIIRGYIVSTEGGGAGAMAKRLVIGFGAGTAEMDTVVEGFVVTSQGLRRLGSGTLSSSGNKTPGLIVPAAVTIATGSPVGLIVVGGAKLYGAASGRSGLEGRAKATADEIANQLRIRFQDRGWIPQG